MSKPIPSKFINLTKVKRGSMSTRLPHKFADTCAALARPINKQGAK